MVEPATMGIITGIGIVEIMGIVHMFESIITTSLRLIGVNHGLGIAVTIPK